MEIVSILLAVVGGIGLLLGSINKLLSELHRALVKLIKIRNLLKSQLMGGKRKKDDPHRPK